MTKLEKENVLEICENTIKELTLQQQQNDREWGHYYYEYYGRKTKSVQVIEKISHSPITALVIAGGAVALFSSGQSVAISLGVPGGCYVAIGLFNIFSKRRFRSSIATDKTYWRKLSEHEERNENIQNQMYPYELILQYLKYGDPYLLHYIRDSITEREESGLEYFDVQTEGLPPLLVSVLEEMEQRLDVLKQELRDNLLKEINLMNEQINHSDEISIRDLESVKKLLIQYIPTLPKES